MGRCLPRGVSHRFQGHRRDHQRSDGLHHRPNQVKTGQGTPVAAAVRAPCGNHGYFALRRPKRQ